MPSEFTFAMLGTQAGAAAAVGIIVQFTKPLFQKLPAWSLRLYVLALSWAVVIAYLAITGQFTATTVFVGVFNGVLVAIMALGGYELLSDPLAQK